MIQLLAMLLGIFAIPILQVIGLFFVICIVAWVLWKIATNLVPVDPPMLRTFAYIAYFIIVGLMMIWWCDLTFGLGLF